MDEGNENNCVFCNSTLTEPVRQNCSRAQPSSFAEEIITIYFIKDYPYRTILKFLDKHHKLKMSLRTLKTKLKIFGLKTLHRNWKRQSERICLNQVPILANLAETDIVPWSICSKRRSYVHTKAG